MDRDGNSKMIADSKPASKMIKDVQSTLPDTFDTNSWITRVFPVPHAISRTRAPLAHASKQSRWHCLKGGCMPSFSATGEGAAALSLAPVLWEMRGGQGIEGKATTGPKCCTKPRPAYHPHPGSLIFHPGETICTHQIVQN